MCNQQASTAMKDMIIANLLDQERKLKEALAKSETENRQLRQVRESAQRIVDRQKKQIDELTKHNLNLGSALRYCKGNNNRLRLENKALYSQLKGEI